MISEAQANALLASCESSLGRQLTRLRATLKNSDDTLGSLWELITLHTALQLGQGIDHEPAERCPDVLIELNGAPRFWIEATHLSSQRREEGRRLGKFIDWIRRELHTKHDVPPNRYRVRLNGETKLAVPSLAHEHEWPHIRRHEPWKAFVARCRTLAGNKMACDAAMSLPPPNAAVLILSFVPTPDKYLSSSHPSPKSPSTLSEHPVWSALRSKGKQAGKWKLDCPLVVCIGDSLSSAPFHTEGFGPSSDAAVAGALEDTSQWHWIHQHNLLRDTSGQCVKVYGAKRISAVLLVSIVDKHSSWHDRDDDRYAKTRLIVNREAIHPLDDRQLGILSQLNWNSFPYGPQWETWPTPTAKNWKNPERILNRSEPGKAITYSPNQDGGFQISVPVEDVARILTGTHQTDSLAPIQQQLRTYAELARVHSLENAEVIPGDALQRKPAMLRLSFGRPRDVTVQGLKLPKDK